MMKTMKTNKIVKMVLVSLAAMVFFFSGAVMSVHADSTANEGVAIELGTASRMSGSNDLAMASSSHKKAAKKSAKKTSKKATKKHAKKHAKKSVKKAVRTNK